jgi:hypothetical protein
MALRRIFGPKRDEVMGGWRKPHSEELLDLYCLMIKLRKMRWVGNVARMEEEEHVYVIGKKTRGKELLG